MGSAVDVTGSVHEAQTIERVRDALSRAVWQGETPDLERPHLAAAHELDAAARALEEVEHAKDVVRAGDPVDLIAPGLQRAYAALGHITGDEAGEELLAGIFARFCIGK